MTCFGYAKFELFDYIDDDNMVSYSVRHVKDNVDIIENLYGYFDPFQSYSENFFS